MRCGVQSSLSILSWTRQWAVILDNSLTTLSTMLLSAYSTCFFKGPRQSFLNTPPRELIECPAPPCSFGCTGSSAALDHIIFFNEIAWWWFQATVAIFVRNEVHWTRASGFLARAVVLMRSGGVLARLTKRAVCSTCARLYQTSLPFRKPPCTNFLSSGHRWKSITS